MQAVSPSTRACARCGGALPPARQGRVCPRCLSAALRGEPAPAEDVAPRVQGLGKFGEYELLSVAGRGGMGVVYRARHSRLGREVALKMVGSAVLAGEAAARRFQAEMESMAGLDHPHLMPVYECGEVDGQSYYTMKIVEGGHLSSRMKEASWPIAERVRLLVKVTRAVDYAHRHGVLHRDLKPANIMVDAADEPYVCDFGLARRLEGDSSLTLSGAALGTPEYMAPEQAVGQSSRVTTAADVYSIGAILYELLAGRPPFRGGTALETMRQVMEQDPVSPSTVVRTADRDLETIALKCLSKEPAKRYSSAAALGDDLERWLRHEPITARRPGAVERVAKWLRRHPAQAVAAVVCIAGAGAFFWQHWREEQRVKSERDRAEQGWAAARARHYAADMDAVADALERGDYGVAAAKLEAHRSSENRGLEWSIYERALTGDQVRLMKTGAAVRQVEWSVDGKLLAAANSNEVITLWNAADGTPAGRIPDPAVPNEWDLSAWKARDAARRLKHDPSGAPGALLTVVGLKKNANSPNTTLAPAAHGLSFSMDGTILASADNDGTKFWRLRDRWLYDWLPGHGGPGVFLSNGRYLAAEAAAPHDLGEFDLATGVWKVLHPGAGSVLAVSPDRKLAATINRGLRRLRVFSLPDATLLDEWSDAAFERSSKLVLVTNSEKFLLRTASQPRLMEGNWREKRWVRTLGEGMFSDSALFALKNDNAYVAITDQEQRVRLHMMSDGVVIAPLRGKRSALLSMKWSPDNLTLATGEEDGSVRLWQPEKRRMSWQVCEGGVEETLVVSPDGTEAIAKTSEGIVVIGLKTGKVRTVAPSAEAVVAGWDGQDALFLDRAGPEQPVELCVCRNDQVVSRSPLENSAGWKFSGGDRAAVMGSRWLWLGNHHNGNVRIHDRVSRALIREAVSEWHSFSPALSPDEKTLALGCTDGTLRLLTWPGGAVLRTLSGVTPVHSLVWTVNGREIAAGGRDGTIRLYTGDSLTYVAALNGHASEVWGLDVSRDGRRLVSAASDSRVRLWDLETRQPLGRLPAGILAPRVLGGFAGDQAIAAGLWGGLVMVWSGNP